MPDQTPSLHPQRPIDWRTLRLWQIQPLRDAAVIIAVLGILYIGDVLSIVTVPMLLAMLLAYLFEPLVSWMTTRAKWMSRQGAAVAIIVATAVLIVGPVVLGTGFAIAQGYSFANRTLRNVVTLAEVVGGPADPAARARLPNEGWRNLADELIDLRQKADRSRRESEQAPAKPSDPAPTGAEKGPASPPPATPASDPLPPQPTGDAPAAADAAPIDSRPQADPPDPVSVQAYRAIDAAFQWVKSNAPTIGKQAFSTGVSAVEVVVRWMLAAGYLVFGGFLTAFFFFFFCTGYGKVLAFWERLIPERRRGSMISLIRQMDGVISGFVRGRLTIGALMVLYYTLAYWLVGVPAPLVLGPIVGVLSLVPYAAFIIGAPSAMLLIWLGPTLFGWQGAWWWVIGGPILVHGASQLLDDYVLTPVIQGRNTGMDTPTILFASLAGGVLAGFYGLLVAIPVAACLKILVREMVWPRIMEWAEGKARDPLPISRL